MTEQADSPSLKEVTERFLACERELRELHQATSTLGQSSASLEDAKSAIRKTAEGLDTYIASLQTLSERLSKATATIEATDPAELTRRIDSLDETAKKHEEALLTTERLLVRRVNLCAVLIAVVLVVTIGLCAWTVLR